MNPSIRQTLVFAAGWTLCIATMGLSGCASPAPPAPLSAERESERIQALFAHWVRAQGGGERLQQLRSLESDLHTGDQPGRSILVHAVEAPDGRVRYDITMPSGFVSSGGGDGSRCWQDLGPLGFMSIPAAASKRCLWQDYCFLALQLNRDYPQQRLLADAAVSDRSCAVVGVTGRDKIEQRWFFDRKTGRLLRVERPEPPTMITQEFSDFRKIAGLTLPFTLTCAFNGTPSVYHRDNVQVDAGVSAISFSPSESQIQSADALDALLKRSQSTPGGESMLQRTHSRVVHASMNSATYGVTMHLTIRQKDPDLIRVEMESPGLGRTTSGFDGATGWENSEIRGFHILNSQELGNLGWLALLGGDLHLRERYPLRLLLGTTTLAGHRVSVVQLATFAAVAGVFYFDQETGHLLRIEPTPGGSGEPKMHIDYSDYRIINEVPIAFRIDYARGSENFSIKCESIEGNAVLDDAFFKPPRDE
jgi:hypothetical protein